MKLRNDTGNGKETHRTRPPGIGAADALFAALADLKTAAFIKTVFSRPELRPAVTTEKNPCQVGRKRFWEVAIIEKPPAPPRLKNPLLNVAHVLIDAADGRVRERWFLTKVQDDEYRDFLRTRFSRPEGCKDRIR
jgi:hypothetical protein